MKSPQSNLVKICSRKPPMIDRSERKCRHRKINFTTSESCNSSGKQTKAVSRLWLSLHDRISPDLSLKFKFSLSFHSQNVFAGGIMGHETQLQTKSKVFKTRLSKSAFSEFRDGNFSNFNFSKRYIVASYETQMQKPISAWCWRKVFLAECGTKWVETSCECILDESKRV